MSFLIPAGLSILGSLLAHRGGVKHHRRYAVHRRRYRLGSSLTGGRHHRRRYAVHRRRYRLGSSLTGGRQHRRRYVVHRRHRYASGDGGNRFSRAVGRYVKSRGVSLAQAAERLSAHWRKRRSRLY